MQRMAGQTPWESAVESCIGTIIGFGVSWLIQMTLVPLILGVKFTATQGFWVVVLYTVVSWVRSYWVRRGFNWWHHKRGVVN